MIVSKCCSARYWYELDCCSKCKEHCETYDDDQEEEVKEFRIDGKGYFGSVIEKDCMIPYLNVCDIEYGSGFIKFKGTETQLDDFLIELGNNEMYFKAIGVHTIKQNYDEI